MWHVWKGIFNSVVDKHTPFRTKRVRALNRLGFHHNLRIKCTREMSKKLKLYVPTFL